MSETQTQIGAYADLHREGHESFVRQALAEVPLSSSEAGAVCDACNGTMLMVGDGWRAVWAELLDADRLDGLGEKWSVDIPALAGRLREVSLGAQYALAVTIERFWRQEQVAGETLAEALRRAGFVLTD